MHLGICFVLAYEVTNIQKQSKMIQCKLFQKLRDHYLSSCFHLLQICNTEESKFPFQINEGGNRDSNFPGETLFTQRYLWETGLKLIKLAVCYTWTT